ncbi:MAG TPA: GntR family transcriptional regulator [Amycolatopsis sp.]|nr:GntR family transcriptional regulator [Amycolatopsis sp.]
MAEVVAERIRVRIARGELAGGDPLPSETVLLERYGVARPTMREALRILESEGLVTVKRGKHGGPRVALPRVTGVARQAGFLLQVRGATLADVYRARRIIESPAVESVAALRAARVLDSLEANLERARSLVDDDEKIIVEGTALHDDFHRVLVEVGAGETLLLFHQVIQSVIDRSSRSFVEHLSTSQARRRAFRAAVRVHEQVVAAIRDRDADRLESVWLGHLRALERSMMRGGHDPRRVVDLYQ